MNLVGAFAIIAHCSLFIDFRLLSSCFLLHFLSISLLNCFVLNLEEYDAGVFVHHDVCIKCTRFDPNLQAGTG